MPSVTKVQVLKAADGALVVVAMDDVQEESAARHFLLFCIGVMEGRDRAWAALTESEALAEDVDVDTTMQLSLDLAFPVHLQKPAGFAGMSVIADAEVDLAQVLEVAGATVDYFTKPRGLTPAVAP